MQNCPTCGDNDALSQLLRDTCPSLTPGVNYVLSVDPSTCQPVVQNLTTILTQLAQGSPGVNGTNGWSPVFAAEADGARRVLKIVAYVGGTGSAPSVPADPYVTASGYGVLASAIDFRGAAGANGSNGWAPVFALEIDGARRVLKIVNYVGGTGSPPTLPTDPYVTASGYGVLASAIDIRGAAGSGGSGPYSTLTIVSGLFTSVLINSGTGGTNTMPPAGAAGAIRYRVDGNTLTLDCSQLQFSLSPPSSIEQKPLMVQAKIPQLR